VIVSVSNSLLGRHWKLDHVPAVGHPTHIVQLGADNRVSAAEIQRRVALHRLSLPENPFRRQGLISTSKTYCRSTRQWGYVAQLGWLEPIPAAADVYMANSNMLSKLAIATHRCSDGASVPAID
jgi:hypothetical protein